MSNLNHEPQKSYLYVIDGTQRLKVLYNCLHNNYANKDSRYFVGFDLNKETFIDLEKDDNLAEIIVLSCLFSSDEIIKKQILLSSKKNSQYLLKNLNTLVSALVEYKLPLIVVMDEDNLKAMATIFERINVRGMSLSEEEILRARKINTSTKP